jgi:CRISPR-associated exonuclease Cas4
MFSENQLLPISALQHLIFCERQCALIHVEQLWAENVLTVEGKQLHEKAHEGKSETAGSIRIARSLWLKSNQLGLIGQADIVEFHDNGQVIPVEYKRGKPKKDDSDRVQICAQAMCLEEMLNVSIDQAFLFYGTKQRRTEVAIDQPLREITRSKIDRLRQMIDQRETPVAARMPKCDKCSLVELCMPDSQRLSRGVKAWNERQYSLASKSDVPESDMFSIYE